MNSRYALPPEPRLPYLGPQGLWNRAEAIVAGVLGLLGALGLTTAWRGSAGEAEWRANETWIVLGVASTAVAGLGIVLWLVVGKLRIIGSRRVVMRALARRLDRTADADSSTPTEGFVTVAGMRRYHRPNCLLLHGKEAVPVDGSRSGLRSCGVCES